MNFQQSTQKSKKLSKAYNVIEELCIIALKNDAIFEKELTCALKNDLRNLENF